MSEITGLALFALITTYFGFSAGAGFVVGCVWSLTNLLFIGLSVEALLARQGKLRMVVIALVKVPVLYAIGFGIIWFGYFPIQALLAGFTWPLVVITLKAAGRLILGLDDARKKRRAQYLGTDESTTATALSRNAVRENAYGRR